MERNEKFTEDCAGIDRPNNDTELVFIIDRSGSMSGFEADTVGGFNSMIEKQKTEGEGMVYVSTVTFNNHSEIIHDRVPIMDVKKMVPADVVSSGCTALFDAIGEAIKHIGTIHRYARRDDVPAHTIFVVTTDGMENASRQYSREKVKKMIEYRTKKCGWEFIFVAANIDAEEAAGDIGISAERTATYEQSEEGFADCYKAMGSFVSMKRCRTMSADDVSWRGNLEKNNKKKNDRK